MLLAKPPLNLFLYIALFIFSLFEHSYCAAQPLSYRFNKDFINNSKANMVCSVNNCLRKQYPFVIGRNHHLITDKYNHPYYEYEWLNGTIIYEGVLYPVGKLKFDIEADKLIYFMYTNQYEINSIALDEHFIKEFILKGAIFRYYSTLKNKKGKKQEEGYYEVVYDGKLKLLVRRKKEKVLDDNTEYLRYKSSISLFLLQNGIITHINSMSGLLKRLGVTKKQMSIAFADEGLVFNGFDYTLASNILRYYESNLKL